MRSPIEKQRQARSGKDKQVEQKPKMPISVVVYDVGNEELWQKREKSAVKSAPARRMSDDDVFISCDD